MFMDVSDLRDFYTRPLGVVSRRLVGRHLRSVWPDLSGLSLAGFGYATPYLTPFRDEAERLIALMPAQQGVVNWPPEGPSVSALVEDSELPLGDGTIDRVLLVHCLEMAETPGALLHEVWRVLAPAGRILVVVPNRRGLWARTDRTPFGSGRPFSRGQLVRLLKNTLFTPAQSREALYVPPIERGMFVSAAPAWERVGTRLPFMFGGVIVLEATKQLYAPRLARAGERARARMPVLVEPVPQAPRSLRRALSP